MYCSSKIADIYKNYKISLKDKPKSFKNGTLTYKFERNILFLNEIELYHGIFFSREYFHKAALKEPFIGQTKNAMIVEFRKTNLGEITFTSVP